MARVPSEAGGNGGLDVAAHVWFDPMFGHPSFAAMDLLPYRTSQHQGSRPRRFSHPIIPQLWYGQDYYVLFSSAPRRLLGILNGRLMKISQTLLTGVLALLLALSVPGRTRLILSGQAASTTRDGVQGFRSSAFAIRSKATKYSSANDSIQTEASSIPSGASAIHSVASSIHSAAPLILSGASSIGSEASSIRSGVASIHSGTFSIRSTAVPIRSAITWVEVIADPTAGTRARKAFVRPYRGGPRPRPPPGNHPACLRQFQ